MTISQALTICVVRELYVDLFQGSGRILFYRFKLVSYGLGSDGYGAALESAVSEAREGPAVPRLHDGGGRVARRLVTVSCLRSRSVTSAQRVA